MAELLGGIQRGLGAALSAIYQGTHSYALAIILLTIAVRALLVPLTVKQIKSMSAMQKLAPEQKKIQQKYKQLQQKTQDRMEVQQLRLKMNEEMQGLFKQHGVNPLGGCFPLIAQMPVFIAMFSIMRAAILVAPMTVTAVAPATVQTLSADARNVKGILCLPVDPVSGEEVLPSATGTTPLQIHCSTSDGKDYGRFSIANLREKKDGSGQVLTNAAWISACEPTGDAQRPFVCHSALGTGHLPRDGKLFADVTADRATVVGMHSGCSASQINAADKIRTCTAHEGKGGAGKAVPYYVLIGLIVVTSYYSSKQMAKRATGAQAQQQRIMTVMMPAMFGLISLNIPAGANMYFLATNVWTIGQQHILLKKQDQAAAADQASAKPREKPDVEPGLPKPSAPAGTKPHPSSKKKRKKR